MSDNPTQQTQKPPPEKPPETGCGDCQPGLIDCLRCRTQAIARQAEYNATAQPELEAAQKAYEEARRAYRAKRRDVSLEVQDLRHENKRLLDRLRCLIKQESVVRCLDDAWCEIAGELDTCTGTPICCSEKVTPAPEVPDVDWDCGAPLLTDDEYEALEAGATAHRNRADKFKACFESLVKEPEELGKRVQEIRAAIDAITAGLAADSATVDLKELYAKALVARRHLRLVWNGFNEAKDYADCLCRTLTCWSSASAAISKLLGRLAFEECRRAADQARCEELRKNTVDQILTRYEKLCPQDDCEGEDTPVDPDCEKPPPKPDQTAE
ncbi:hypothetical protein [Longispora albida]|uniref:hypothetical protein n=1 Tax=Longispora albida TaxID=203523 RepID=UPI000378FC03|nr:hypothetical protein [Longispora albida]